jgi:alpha-tubulin suppressor-like RCC1 family protein
VIAAGVSVAGFGGCAKVSPANADSGGLAIVLESDMSIPKDIDRVTLQVTQQGQSLLHVDRNVGAAALPIPSTFEVKSTGNAAPVSIQAVAYKSGQARVERDAVTPIPDDHVGELQLALNYLCVGTAQTEADGGVGSTCPDGQTCAQGACVTATVPASSLPTYAPGASDTGPDSSVSGCFDVQACFASAVAAPVDMATCTASLPSGASAATINVALQFPSGSAGVCGPMACWVVFDEGTDWTVSGSQIKLPAGACTSAAAQGATLVVTTACTAKTEAVPECGAWSPVTTPVSEPSGGMSAVGTSCAGPMSQSCGLCGTQTRTCSEGTWSTWSACEGEGVCQPDATQTCGTGGTQTCGSTCQWGACACTSDLLTCGAPGACSSPGDVLTCGACGNDCTALANVSSTGIACAAGKCTYTCASGFADCSSTGAGCTADLSQPASCGACGHDCTDLPHVSGPTTCGTSGACAIPSSSCASGYGDCNGDPSDGCEASLTQPTACGVCGNVCSGGTPLCSIVEGKYQCVANCSATQTTLCGSSCVDTTSDASNCGACTQVCSTQVQHAQAVCTSSTCTFTCNSGYIPCNGACVAKQTDNNNCGGCGNICPSGSSCQNSSCVCSGASSQACGDCGTQTRTCSGGTWSAWSACSMPQGACAPSATQACDGNGTQTCTSTCGWGACSCNTGYVMCTGACVNEKTDSANCGGCAAACPSGSSCQNSSCTCSGASSQVCGNCGTQSRTCSDGTWSAWSACSGQGACAPSATESCEGNGTQTCSASCQWGACSCNSGSTLCSGECVNLNTDTNNCGQCGKPCGGTCAGGSCTAVTAIGAGDDHTCAVFSTGSVKCWGYNPYGSLGNGTTTNSSTPVVVSNLTSAVAIVAGSYHTCALLSGGTVECWGYNVYGQLGNGTTMNSSTPVAVSNLTNVTAIASGSYHTCALVSGGTVQCWGYNNDGQIGNGTSNVQSTPTPAGVSGLGGVTAIAAGGDHTCALISDGTVQCWGYNQFGGLGNGTTTSSSTPVPVSGLGGATAIAAGGNGENVGYDHTCALFSGGAVQCWGDDTDGDLGNGTNAVQTLTPVSVSNLTGAIATAEGYFHTCALLSGGTVQCWGSNTNGQLGIGNTTGPTSCTSNQTCSTTPVAVSNLTGVTAVAAGGDHSCALLSSGVVECWGDNTGGDLGNGGTTLSSVPVRVQW